MHKTEQATPYKVLLYAISKGIAWMSDPQSTLGRTDKNVQYLSLIVQYNNYHNGPLSLNTFVSNKPSHDYGNTPG